MFRQIDERMLVSGQLQPADVQAAADAGVTMIVNNRPDGEQPGQPAGAEIEAAARAAGLDYRHIPVAGGLSPDLVEAMGEALDAAADGKVLGFCAAGTRSTYLWALARLKAGEDVEDIITKGGAAGYELSALRNFRG